MEHCRILPSCPTPHLDLAHAAPVPGVRPPPPSPPPGKWTLPQPTHACPACLPALQSKSFFERDGHVQEQDRSASDSDGDEYYSGGDGAAEHWEQAAAHRSPLQRQQQQRGRAAWASRSGSGSGSRGSSDYQPPVVQLNTTLLAASEAVAQFEAEQAAAAAGAAESGATGPPPARRLAGARQMAHQASSGSGSGASTAQFSVTSFEVAPPAGGATPLPALADEDAEQQGPQGPLQRAAEAAQWPFMAVLQVGASDERGLPESGAGSRRASWPPTAMPRCSDCCVAPRPRTHPTPPFLRRPRSRSWRPTATRGPGSCDRWPPPRSSSPPSCSYSPGGCAAGVGGGKLQFLDG